MKAECDIVLLSYESPGLLKRCVESVLENTTVHSRLIIVDNASKDPEVSRYLQKIHGNDRVSIEKVFSEENVGFAAGMNKGMRLSDTPFVCLLNNDCMVTKGWLEGMIDVARQRDDVGLVNPQSNTFGSRPDGSASVSEHAELLQYRKGKFLELGHAIAFACLIKREVIEKIGYFDEMYEGVCYEDTDFSARANKAGYIAVMAEGSYVFHEEQASRKTLKGRKEIYRKNRELFEKRWGRLLRIFYVDPKAVSEDRMNRCYETMKGIARERAIVEMWVKRDRSTGEIFIRSERRKTTRHADVAVKGFSRGFMGPAVLWRVLTKKKRFDAVIMYDGFVLRLLRLLRPLHKAEVFSIRKKMLVMAGDGMLYDLNNPPSVAKYLRRR